MFTGIIEEIGKVLNISSSSSYTDASATGKCLEIEASKILEDIQIGDSIAVNGVCLTARSIKKHSFCADVMPETLRRSNLGSLKVGSRVNLERAMKADGRFGGHFVLGHIDTCTKLVRIKKEQNATWFFISLEEKYLRYIAEKGSLCINGVSLTVASIENNLVGVSLIPHSFSNTNLGYSCVGDMLNIECDILAKHAENEAYVLGATRTKDSNIDLDFLAKNGFI